ncbi:MAG TPA: zf-HC2 domain-containing protein [Nocardioides sp.]|nr:zf-HC2 domain-containing protein [Nocardioides sp.]
MSTTTWHADPALLQAYVAGELDAVLSASLERHVERCPECRGAVRPLADGPLLDEAWAGVRERVESRPLPAAIRLAQRLGLREPSAVLLSAAASLRLAWLSSCLVALGFATVATLMSEDRLWPFLLVAPLIPVLGVAAAYGDADDPFEALAVTAPYGRTRLVLLRTVGVLVTTLPVAGLFGLFLPGPAWIAAAWFGPALAMVPVLMALASFIGPRMAGPLVTILWCGVVLGAVRELPPTWPIEATQQLVYVGLALVALAVLAARSVHTRKIGAAL